MVEVCTFITSVNEKKTAVRFECPCGMCASSQRQSACCPPENKVPVGNSLYGRFVLPGTCSFLLLPPLPAPNLKNEMIRFFSAFKTTCPKFNCCTLTMVWRWGNLKTRRLEGGKWPEGTLAGLAQEQSGWELPRSSLLPPHWPVLCEPGKGKTAGAAKGPSVRMREQHRRKERDH